MNANQERQKLIERYPGDVWKAKVNKMSDQQVHAVFMRLVQDSKEKS